MRTRLHVRHLGVAQLTLLAVVGVGLGLIAGFMFMSVADTVSCDRMCDIRHRHRRFRCISHMASKILYVGTVYSFFSAELDI